MRIAIWHNLPSGGGKRSLYDQVQGLVARGHHVEAWCPSTADQGYLPLSTLIAEHVKPVAISAKDHGSFLPPKKGGWIDYLRRPRRMAQHAEECAHEIEARGFDVLFAHDDFLEHAPRLGRHYRGAKVLYLAQPNRALYEAAPRLLWEAPKAGTRWSTRVKDTLIVSYCRGLVREEATNARAFDRVLTNSYYSREVMLRAYGLDGPVCYLGIDAERFAFREEPREPFVIGLGSFIWHKGVDTALATLARMPAPRPRLVWVANFGDAQFEQQMRERAAATGVTLEIKKQVSDAELVDLLNRASAMLYASRLEPFGLAPLEANACGVPVVAVAEGGVRETVRDGVNGFLADRDPAALAEALQKVLTPEIGEPMRRAAAAHVREHWSLARGIDRLEGHLLAAAQKKEAAR